jgi:hypothetical protein
MMKMKMKISFYSDNFNHWKEQKNVDVKAIFPIMNDSQRLFSSKKRIENPYIGERKKRKSSTKRTKEIIQTRQ